MQQLLALLNMLPNNLPLLSLTPLKNHHHPIIHQHNDGLQLLNFLTMTSNALFDSPKTPFTLKQAVPYLSNVIKLSPQMNKKQNPFIINKMKSKMIKKKAVAAVDVADVAEDEETLIKIYILNHQLDVHPLITHPFHHDLTNHHCQNPHPHPPCPPSHLPTAPINTRISVSKVLMPLTMAT